MSDGCHVRVLLLGKALGYSDKYYPDKKLGTMQKNIIFGFLGNEKIWSAYIWQRTIASLKSRASQ